MVIEREDRIRLRRLRDLVLRLRRDGPARMAAADLEELPRLYRHACTQLARLETRGEIGRDVVELRRLVGRAHGLLYRAGDTGIESVASRALRFLLADCPRAIRQEWKLIGFFALAFYGLAGAAWYGVARDLDLSYSLFNREAVDAQIEQLRDTPQGERFVGNFNFGVEQSGVNSAAIITNNVRVGLLFFALGLIPPLYLYVLLTNSLMLGTYTGVAWHWGQAGSISSILWCHGVLELQALLLAGAAGLVLVRAWIAPGPWSRGHAMAIESRQAWRLLAPMFPLLLVAGVIEGFVSPHAPLGVRLAVAIGSGIALVAWVVLGGRQSPSTGSPA